MVDGSRVCVFVDDALRWGVLMGGRSLPFTRVQARCSIEKEGLEE